jgi:dienelactone hydrolase
MNRLKIMVAALLLSMVSSVAWGKVTGKEVEYRSGDTVLKGYLAENPKFKGKRPAVIVVHEWWGHDEYARKRARMLAEMGYTSLAVDMYGEGRTAKHPEDAGKFAGELMKNKALSEARFNAALEFVKKQPSVDPARIAAIGYCFGGGVVLHMARQGTDLRGVVSFHGVLSTDSPAQPGVIKAKIQVFTGGADVMVPPEVGGAFVTEMEKAGAFLRFVSFPGVKHSFTNPAADRYAREFNLPLAYDAKADERSWKETGIFLKTIMK